MDTPQDDTWTFRYIPRAPVTSPKDTMPPAELEARLLADVEAAGADPCHALNKLADHYSRQRRPALAFECFKRMLRSASNAADEARYWYSLGTLHEEFGDFATAAVQYRRALALEPVDLATLYFSTNNLGFCLNAAGRHVEAEVQCRRAIEYAPHHPSGHKNLGIALRGQGRFAEAARAFITSVQADAGDGRAYPLLDNLLAEHPELLPEFGWELEHCREAVRAAHERCLGLRRGGTG